MMVSNLDSVDPSQALSKYPKTHFLGWCGKLIKYSSVFDVDEKHISGNFQGYFVTAGNALYSFG